MNIDWQKIEEKYPKALNKFCEYKNVLFCKEMDTNFAIESEFKQKDGFCLLLPEEICYCDLEKFFDDNGIDFLELYVNQKDIITKQHIWENRDIDKNRIKQETKEEAILKAFEILEERLNGKENIRSKNI